MAAESSGKHPLPIDTVSTQKETNATLRSRILRCVSALARLFLLFAFALSGATLAQSLAPLLHAVGTHRAVGLVSKQNVVLKCPAGQVPTGLSISRTHPNSLVVDGYALVDSNGIPVDLGSLASIAPIVGGGYTVAIENIEDEGQLEDAEIFITCLDPSVATDNALALVTGSGLVAANSTVSVNAF